MQTPCSDYRETKGLIYFARMLDKIRQHGRGELGAEYLENLGTAQSADGFCCNYLRVRYDDLRARALEGGTDEQLLEWCFEKGRRLNEGDLMVWNGFLSKIGWRDFASGALEEAKNALGVEDRADIGAIADVIDFEEGRRPSP